MAVNWDKLSRSPDRTLRPWAVNAEMDTVLDEAYQDLQTSTRRCSPFGKGGPYGLSLLDRTPLELKELEELIRHPERFEDTDGQLKRKKRITRKKPVPVQVNATGNDDKSKQRSSTKESLRKANRYVSSALDNKANLIRERNQKNPIKACYQLDSIKYTESGPRKGPAVFNMSMAEYQRFLGIISLFNAFIATLILSYSITHRPHSFAVIIHSSSSFIRRYHSLTFLPPTHPPSLLFFARSHCRQRYRHR